MMRSPFRAGLAAALTLMPTLAFAHTGIGDAHGFTHGFMHPVSGLDHVLAMVTVGILAAQMGGRTLWLVPSTFVAVMAIGGALGFAGIDVPFVELGIALSVVGLGAAVALGVTPPLGIIVGLVALFAIFHGHAHGAEMPETASGLAYGGGFMLGTALLHVAGIGIGMGIERLAAARGPLFVRGAGAAVAVAGLGLVTGIL